MTGGVVSAGAATLTVKDPGDRLYAAELVAPALFDVALVNDRVTVDVPAEIGVTETTPLRAGSHAVMVIDDALSPATAGLLDVTPRTSWLPGPPKLQPLMPSTFVGASLN